MQSDVIWCHLVSSVVIWCHLMSYDVIWCHLLSSDTTSCYLMLDTASYKLFDHWLPDRLTAGLTIAICRGVFTPKKSYSKWKWKLTPSDKLTNIVNFFLFSAIWRIFWYYFIGFKSVILRTPLAILGTP